MAPKPDFLTAATSLVSACDLPEETKSQLLSSVLSSQQMLRESNAALASVLQIVLEQEQLKGPEAAVLRDTLALGAAAEMGCNPVKEDLRTYLQTNWSMKETLVAQVMNAWRHTLCPVFTKNPAETAETSKIKDPEEASGASLSGCACLSPVLLQFPCDAQADPWTRP